MFDDLLTITTLKNGKCWECAPSHALHLTNVPRGIRRDYDLFARRSWYLSAMSGYFQNNSDAFNGGATACRASKICRTTTPLVREHQF